MQCSNFFQPYIDWLNTPPDPGVAFNTVAFLVVGNRSEANRFVLYMEGVLTQSSSTQLGGSATQFFSDRISRPPTGLPAQPFDVNNTDQVNVTLTVPDGPLVFSNPSNGALVAQFSTFECRDNGLLVCTSNFDRTILVVSFTNSFQLKIQ